MILYASEVTDSTKSVLAMVDNLIDRAVLKIFKVSEKHVIHDIRDFLGLRDVTSLCEMRQQDNSIDACYSTVINGTVLLIVFFFCFFCTTGCIVYVSL